MEFVTELNSHDVLFGRGSGPNDHEGNIRFRKLVAERKEEYMATNHRMTKAKIAKEIVDQVFANSGRFLKKMEPTEMKEHNLAGMDAWVLVDEDTIMEKAKQALRQNPNKTPKEKSTKPTPTHTASTEVYATGHVSAVTPVPQTVSLEDYNLEPLPIGSMSSTFVKDSAPMMSTEAGVMAGMASSQQPAFVSQQAAAQQLLWAQQQQMQSQPPAYVSTDGSIPSSVPGHSPIVSSSGFVTDSTEGLVGETGEEPGELPNVPSNLRGSITMSDVENRRGSISINDLMRMHRLRERGFDRSSERHSMEMDDLLDSFSKSRISHDEQKRMYASSETMGTIEPMSAGSVADMSLGTINSSTFSFHKGNDSIFEDRPVTDIDARLITTTSATTRREDGTAKTTSTRSIMSDASMSIAELRSRRKSLQKQPNAPETGTASATSGNTTLSSNTTLGTASGSVRQVAGMMEHPSLDLEGMGNSSVEMLKGMLFSSNELAQDAVVQRQQQSLAQQQQQEQYLEQQQRQEGETSTSLGVEPSDTEQNGND